MPAKQKLSQRKALRSAAAKKGWETRRAKEADDWGLPTIEEVTALVREMEKAQAARQPDPTPATSNWLHRIWAKITGTA